MPRPFDCFLSHSSVDQASDVHGSQPLGIVCKHVRDLTATRVFYGAPPGEEGLDCLCADCWDAQIADAPGCMDTLSVS